MNRVNSYNQIIRSISELEQKFEREPTDDEIAEALNVTEDYVTQIKRVGSRPASLDAPLKTGDEMVNLIDIVKDTEAQDPEANSITHSLKKDINTALKLLKDRESEILILFYGLNEEPNLTLHDISLTLEITQERVRQIKECALNKLQRSLKGDNYLKSYLG